MVSRGLAKCGSNEPYWDGDTNEQRPRRTLVVRMMFSKGPGRRGRVRFLPGCLVFSIVASIVLTIVLNLVLRAF